MGIRENIKLFFGIKKKKDLVLTSLEPDVVESKALKEAYKKIQSLENQLSKISLKKTDENAEEKDFLNELKLVKVLKQKSDSIKHQEIKDTFEINKISEYLKKHPKSKIDITDKDDEVVFDTFKSFVFFKKGNKTFIGIKGNSEKVWSYGSTLDNIIHKPESIRNHLKRKRIPIPYDKELRYLPDLEKVMIRKLKYNPKEDSFQESEELMQPFREMIMEEIRKNHNLIEDKEYLESLNANLTRNLFKIERAFNVLKTQSHIENSDLTASLTTMLETSKRLGEMTRQNTLLAQQKISADELMERYEKVFTRILNDMEDEKGKTAVRRARDEFHRDLQFTQKLEKRPIFINSPENIKETEMEVKK